MKCATNSLINRGAMAELVDASVLGTDFLGSEGSSPFRPTIDDYDTVYDTSYSSTIKKRKVWLYNKKSDFDGLRKNHTFHLKYICVFYTLITTQIINLTSSTLVWWSCRRFTKTTRRRTPVLVIHKEMFALCPQKHTSHHYSYN